MGDYKIWCVYHRPEIPQEYNLHESEHFKLFYNNDLTLKEDNINYLHDYLCELTAYYYVWKNNLKSDIVGFCHYSKSFNNIDYAKLNNFGFQAYSYCYERIDLDNIEDYNMERYHLFYDYITYLKYKYNIDYYNYILKHDYIFDAWHNMYIFKWDVFCDLCDFIFGYLDYVFPNGLWKIKSNLDFLVKYKGPINPEEIIGEHAHAWWPRYLAVFFEKAIGTYLGIKYNCNDYVDKYSICNDDENNINDYVIMCDTFINEHNFNQFESWVKNNIKTGITHYVIKSSYTYEQIYKLLEANNNLQVSSVFNKYIYSLGVCENTNKFNEFKNQLIEQNIIPINLQLNERINCNDSIDMHKGNYCIEQF